MPPSEKSRPALRILGLGYVVHVARKSWRHAALGQCLEACESASSEFDLGLE